MVKGRGGDFVHNSTQWQMWSSLGCGSSHYCITMHFIMYLLEIPCLKMDTAIQIKIYLSLSLLFCLFFLVGCTIALSLLMALPIAMVIMGKWKYRNCVLLCKQTGLLIGCSD